MIWLIDYNHYTVTMDPILADLRKDYFAIKRYVRAKKIGETAPVKTKTFSNGLLRIATILNYNHISVKYIHYYEIDDCLMRPDEEPTIVAFSAVCPTVPRCAELARKIKKQFPNAKMMIGGAHVNQVPELTLEKFPVFDSVNNNYELKAAEFLAQRKLKECSGFYVDYQLLPHPLHQYGINTFTSLGCMFHCDYCADGTAPHFKAMEDGQIGVMKNLLPERTLIHFFDSVLGYSPKGTLEVCRNIKSLNHPFLLSCDMRADVLTPEIIVSLEKAGFVEIRMGLDTASIEVLQQNGRTIMPDTLLNKLKMIRDYSGLYVSLYSITGLPGTTKDLHRVTLDYMRYIYEHHLADEIKNAIYVPYPMRNVDYKNRGVYITDQNWEHYDRSSYPVYRLETLNESDIWNMFLETARWMNTCWLQSIGLNSITEVPAIENGFHEYYESNYLG